MNNINNTLAELEDNLKKMDSARTQVSDLNQLVSQLADAYANSLKQLQKIESSIHYDEDYFADKFGKSIASLDTNINLLHSKLEDHNNSVNTIHEKASQDFISNLTENEEKVKLYVEEMRPSLEKIQNNFKITNDEITVDLKKKINEVIEVSSKKINEIKELDLLREITSIELTTNKIHSNFDKLYNENNALKADLQKLNAEISSKFEKSDTQFKILLGILLLGILLLGVLRFV